MRHRSIRARWWAISTCRAQPFSPPYLPLDAADNFAEPNLILTPEAMMVTHGMQGIVLFPTRMETTSVDLPGQGPTPFGTHQRQLVPRGQ